MTASEPKEILCFSTVGLEGKNTSIDVRKIREKKKLVKRGSAIEIQEKLG